jgi:hypothetical protein
MSGIVHPPLAGPLAVAAAHPIKVNPPYEYDGTPDKYRDWSRTVTLYLHTRKITDDEDKIITTLTYMKGGAAAVFADAYVDTNFVRIPAVPDTWAQFVAKMDDAFEDKNATKKAREQLESFPQGLKKVDVWMAEIETLFSKAGLTKEEEKIRLLKRNVGR